VTGTGSISGANPITLAGDLNLADLTFASTSIVALAGNNGLQSGHVAAGILQVGSTNALASQALLTMDGGTLDLDGNPLTATNTLSGAGALINTGTLVTLNATVTGSLVIGDGPISLGGDLHQADITILSDGNVQFNGVALAQGATQEVASLDVLSGAVALQTHVAVDSGLHVDGGTVQLNGKLDSGTAIYCNGGTLDLNGADLSSPIYGFGTLTNTGATANFNGPIIGNFIVADGSGSIGLNGDASQANLTFSQSGNSVSTFTGGNVSVGGVDLEAGEVQVGSGSEVNVPSGLSIGGGTFRLNGSSPSTPGSLSSTTTIHLSGGTLDLNGVDLDSSIDGL
jgi:hypothetical protein